MAGVSVRVVDFEDGALPWICASSGEEATRRYRMPARNDPWWPFLLVPAGPIGWILMFVAASARRELRGYVPFSDAAHERMVESHRFSESHQDQEARRRAERQARLRSVRR